ncbi:TPA: hypothetical protein ACYELC_005010, partial [Escherichia coli]
FLNYFTMTAACLARQSLLVRRSQRQQRSPAGKLPHNLEVISRPRFKHGNLPSDARIQNVFREIVLAQDSTSAIADETRL